MTLPGGRKAGDFVLLAEPFGFRGLGQLRGVVERNGEEWLEIAVLPSSARKRYFVSVKHAHRLGDPMAAPEAARIVEAFSAPESLVPDHRDYEQQAIDTSKATMRGSWVEIQQALSRLYAFAWKPAFGQLRLIDHCEHLLVPVLAHALGRDHAELVAELRAGKPAFSATAPRPAAPFVAPPASPPLDREELEPLFPLATTGALSFCDRPGLPDGPKARIARIKLRPGTWHSYTRHTDGGEELFLVHETRLAEGADALLASSWWVAGEIVRTVSIGNVNVLDESALEDAWTLDRMFYLDGTREYRGRALTLSTEGWDGPLPILVAGDLPDRIKIVIG